MNNDLMNDLIGKISKIMKVERKIVNHIEVIRVYCRRSRQNMKIISEIFEKINHFNFHSIDGKTQENLQFSNNKTKENKIKIVRNS